MDSGLTTRLEKIESELHVIKHLLTEVLRMQGNSDYFKLCKHPGGCNLGEDLTGQNSDYCVHHRCACGNNKRSMELNCTDCLIKNK